MKSFYCGDCGMMVFFENNRCLKCDHSLGFAPDTLELCTLEKTPDGQWRVIGAKPENSEIYRNCDNGKDHGICNWLVPTDDPNRFCVSCRLNEIIPNLANPKNIARWSKLELAKRRCIYTFLKLGLPVQNGAADQPLKFRFLEDKEGALVKTGHENGIITINVAEADEDERERRRLNLHEPYRTLVGHFRHESGHYYWDRLIANSPQLPRYRELFGDESVSYDEALKKYYQSGPPAEWAKKTVTPYACAHPWEDWAESWAHYLHIMDTLETASSFGLGTRETPTAKPGSMPIKYRDDMDFDRLLAEWTPLTCALNAINRGMGLSDLYPFSIPIPAVDKLRFIHQVILESKRPK